MSHESQRPVFLAGKRMPPPFKVMPGQRALKYVHTFPVVCKKWCWAVCERVWGFIHCMGLCRYSQFGCKSVVNNQAGIWGQGWGNWFTDALWFFHKWVCIDIQKLTTGIWSKLLIILLINMYVQNNYRLGKFG